MANIRLARRSLCAMTLGDETQQSPSDARPADAPPPGPGADAPVASTAHAAGAAHAASTAHAAPVERLPRAVRVLGWVSFFADISSEMAYPLLPLFVVGALHAPATTLGLIEGLAAVLVALLAFWSGRSSDRTRRRLPAVRWGYGLPIAGKALIAVAVGWPMVLAGRLVDRVGKGLRGSPRDALIADATPAAMRGRAFGFHRAMDTAGACVGGLLSAGLLVLLTDDGSAPASVLRLLFGIAAALGVAAFALTLLLREAPAADVAAPARDLAASDSVASSAAPAFMSPRAAAPSGATSSATSGAAVPPVESAASRHAFGITLAVLAVFALANSSDTFLLLRASGLGLSPQAVVLAWTSANLVFALLAYPVGKLSDRVGRWVPLAFGWTLYAAVYVAFAFADNADSSSPFVAWSLLALYGVHLALVDGVSKALLTDVAAPAGRGTLLGMAAMVTGFASLAGSLAAGWLWDVSGPRAALLLGAGAALLAVTLLPLARRAGRAPGGPRRALLAR